MSVIQPTAAKSPAISAATAPRVWLKAVLISAVPPLLLQTAANPGGLPMKACDQIRSAVLADRAQFFKDISLPFYGYNRPRATVSPGVRDSFWLQGMMAGLPAAYFCIKVVSETDLSEGLQQFNVPPLILHGDDDQIVPIGASALLSSTIVKYATLKVYPGAPHGLASTHKDQLNADLLAFLKAQRLLPAIASRAFLHCEPQYLPAPPGLPGGPIVNDQEITTYLAASHIAVVATVHRDGRPHLTPNWYRYDGQVLTLVTRKDRLKYRHLQRDNRISVCIYDPPAASNYVVITGTATCDDQDIWDEARRIIERYRAPDQVDDYVARWKTEPRVLITVTPERIATRGAGRR